MNKNIHTVPVQWFLIRSFFQMLKTNIMKLKMRLLLPLVLICFLPSACKKDFKGDLFPGKEHDFLASFYDADVPLAWFKLAITGLEPYQVIARPVASRTFGYMGLAFYESVVPGMPDNKSIQHQLNGLPALPKMPGDQIFIDAVSANAALANMVHHMFGNASAAQNFTIDSLENVFNTEFKSFLYPSGTAHFVTKTLIALFSFGQDISNAIYNWSTTDGGDKAYLNVFPSSYMPACRTGTMGSATRTAAQHPFWGNNRTFIKGECRRTHSLATACLFH